MKPWPIFGVGSLRAVMLIANTVNSREESARPIPPNRACAGQWIGLP